MLNIQTGSRIDDESDEYIIKEDLIEINTADTYLVPTILTNLDIYNVNDIDGKTQSFKAGYAVEFAYHDRYNLIKSAEEIFGRSSEWSYAWCEWTNHDDADIWGEIEQLWKPDVDFINRLDFDKDKTVEKISMYYYWADENDPPALFIKYEIRGSAQFSTQFKYETFPFDKQYISIDISNHDGTGLGNIYSVNELAFYTSLFQVELDKAVYKDPREVFSNQSLTSGWRLHEKSTYNENFIIWEAEEIKNSTITTVFGIEQLIERNTKYFIYKIFSPIILILMICWSVFWSPPKELESRLTVTITCFLALVAYTFVIDDDLPQLPYLTLMDQLILISYFFASLPTLFAIISHRISLRDNNLSVTFDKYSKIAGIVGYPLVCYIVISIVAGANLYNTTETLKAITFN